MSSNVLCLLDQRYLASRMQQGLDTYIIGTPQGITAGSAAAILVHKPKFIIRPKKTPKAKKLIKNWILLTNILT